MPEARTAALTLRVKRLEGRQSRWRQKSSANMPQIVDESSHILSGPDLGCLVSLASAVTTRFLYLDKIFDLNYPREAPLDRHRLIEYLAKHLECSRLTHTNTYTKFSERREPHT